MGCDQVAKIRRTQQALKPEDAGQVEMVGWFVEQHEIGFKCQLAG